MRLAVSRRSRVLFLVAIAMRVLPDKCPRENGPNGMGFRTFLRNSRREPMSIHTELMETSRGDEPASRRQVELHRTAEAPGTPTCRALAFQQAGVPARRRRQLAAARKRRAGSSARLLDRNPRITQTFRAHQGEQSCGIRRMQPDAAARGRTAKSRDMRRPVNGE